MADAEFNALLLRRLLDAVGAHLEAQGLTASVIVVGGAALCLRGWVQRTTNDVDVIAVVSDAGDEWIQPGISAALEDAIKRVARDFNIDADWINATVGAQWKTGLPDGIREDVEWLRFRGLRVGLAGRQALITLKLIASVDQWPQSVHRQDLVALLPTDEELERARRWVETQDMSPTFPDAVARVITHVRDRR